MKLYKKIYAVLSTFLLIACGCSNNSSQTTYTSGNKTSSTEQYAKYFSIENHDSTVKHLTIKSSWTSNGQTEEKYLLVPRDSATLLANNPNAIPYPIKSVVCMSSSHVAYFAALNQEHCIKGISGTRFIYNEKVQELIKSHQIEDVGSETLPDYERIIYMKPDIVIAYQINNSNNSYVSKLQKFGIKVLTIGEYLENSPLGKTEYLKLFGELTGCRALADSIFNKTEKTYMEIKNKIAQSNKATDKVKVIMNVPYKGAWYIPGDNNYISQLVKDAGGIVLGAKENEVQSAQLNFEHVYGYALQADVWLHTNALNTVKEICGEHHLLKNIPALTNGRTYNNTLRHTAHGGSDFWETGAVEPHIILQDLAAIFHPELYGNQDLKYYRQIK